MSDLWGMRYIWYTEDQQGILASIVQDVLTEDSNEAARHPRSRGLDSPDPEQLVRDLDRLEERLQAGPSEADRSFHQDLLGLLAARCQWVEDDQKREFLEQRVESLWQLAGREG